MFDLSYGKAKLDLKAIKESIISSIFCEKQDINRYMGDMNDAFENEKLLHAESDAKQLMDSAKRLHNSVRCLHYIVESEKREELEIDRGDIKIEQELK